MALLLPPSDETALDDTSGFIYEMDQQAAQRQLHLSFGIVVVLCIAIAAAALTMHVPQGSASGSVALLHIDMADRS